MILSGTTSYTCDLGMGTGLLPASVPLPFCGTSTSPGMSPLGISSGEMGGGRGGGGDDTTSESGLFFCRKEKNIQ